MCVCVCVDILIYIYFKMSRSTKDLYFFRIFFSYIHFRLPLLSSENIYGTRPCQWGNQRKMKSPVFRVYMIFSWLRVYMQVIPQFFLESVFTLAYFSPRWFLIFDMVFSLGMCVCVCVTVVSDFNYCFFFCRWNPNPPWHPFNIQPSLSLSLSCLWYDLTWNRTPVFQATDEHCILYQLNGSKYSILPRIQIISSMTLSNGSVWGVIRIWKDHMQK